MLDLVVAGRVFFEVFVPPGADWPRLGEERFVDGLSVGLGGALNTASVARGLGLDVALAAPRGPGLTDRAIASEVARLGIHDAPWPAPPDAAVTLVRSTPEDRAFLSAVHPDGLARCPELPRSRWVHVGGLEEAEVFAPRLEEARARGAALSVSAGWDPERLRRLAPAGWALFFANTEEARLLTGRGPGPEAARALVERGLGSIVALTDGPRGAHVAWRAGPGGSIATAHVPAAPIPVVDTTGAGDAFAAGTLAGLVRGLAPDQAAALGARAAERALAVRGGVLEASALAGLAALPDVEASVLGGLAAVPDVEASVLGGLAAVPDVEARALAGLAAHREHDVRALAALPEGEAGEV